MKETKNNNTPFELNIPLDNNNMTTASQLYKFLNYTPTSYSRWCKRNIINNPNAKENIDYIPFRVPVHSCVKNQTKQDYKLTINFAKKLSMTGNCNTNDEVKDSLIDSDEKFQTVLETLSKFDTSKYGELFRRIGTNINSMKEEIQQLKTQNEYYTMKINHLEKQEKQIEKISEWRKETINKIKILRKHLDNTLNKQYSQNLIIDIVIKEMEKQLKIELSPYIERYKNQHLVKNMPNKLIIIEEYRELKVAFSDTLDDLIEKFNIVNNYLITLNESFN